MGHGELICRSCFEEARVKDMARQSRTEGEMRMEVVCPNCGSDSFAV
jgi:Zn finger protein HypA/HybF involved in hydrogenase expression